MLREVGFIPLIFAFILLQSCQTGTIAYNRGDYYTATLQAIQRLRVAPKHKKAIKTLEQSYPLAVVQLNDEVNNKMQSNDEFKYRTAFENYEKINRLYEEIKRSPVATTIIPEPINKHREIAKIKEKATEEVYNAGIQALLKNTREDAKQAYYFFKKANSLSPDYKESIAMSKQAKLNATLNVLIQLDDNHRYGWKFEAAIFGTQLNEFVKFYSPSQAEERHIKRLDQSIRVIFPEFIESQPAVSRSTIEYSDSVKVGDVEIKGKKYPKYELKSAELLKYTKKVIARGSVVLVITDRSSQAEIFHKKIEDRVVWSVTWGICTGHTKILPDHAKWLCDQRETYRSRDYLHDQVKSVLDRRLARELYVFYSSY